MSKSTSKKTTKKTTKKTVSKSSKRSKDTRPIGRPLLFQSVEELQERIDAYFDSCWEEQWIKKIKPEYELASHKKGFIAKDEMYEWKPVLDRHGEIVKHQVRPYVISGLALALGTNRETLLNYEKKEAFFDTIKNAKIKIQTYTEENLYSPKIAAGVIFNLKNNYGYTDKLEHKHDIANTLADLMTGANENSKPGQGETED